MALARAAASLAGPSRRAFATSTRAEATYPFSNRVTFPPVHTPSPPPANLVHPPHGASLVSHVNAGLKSDYDTLQLLGTWFARRSRERVRTGSVMSVLTYSSADRTGVTPFSGVLTRVRRRGVDTSFTLRNVVQKTGVEMNFKVCSPLIKEIKIVKRGGARREPIRDLRRARVNYLRERPGVMSQIAGALKQAQSVRLGRA